MKNRYEEYRSFSDNIPFTLGENIRRTRYIKSREANWHENIEIQYALSGEGEVLVNGEFHTIKQGKIIVINSGLVHYTGTDTELRYSCLIISSEFLENAGIDISSVCFVAELQDDNILSLLLRISETYSKKDDPMRAARLQMLTLELLISLCEDHLVTDAESPDTNADSAAKDVINYIKAHYSEKISLDALASALYENKFVLSRKFKRALGITVFEYLNSYRVGEAARLIARGANVNIAARECGFENLSYFAKTFKKHMGVLPSEYKRQETGV